MVALFLFSIFYSVIYVFNDFGTQFVSVCDVAILADIDDVNLFCRSFDTSESCACRHVSTESFYGVWLSFVIVERGCIVDSINSVKIC